MALRHARALGASSLGRVAWRTPRTARTACSALNPQCGLAESVHLPATLHRAIANPFGPTTMLPFSRRLSSKADDEGTAEGAGASGPEAVGDASQAESSDAGGVESTELTADEAPPPAAGSQAAEVLDLWLQETINQQTKRELEPPAKPQHDIATVNATYNNTIVTITSMDGSVINWASCGSVGFKGAKRSTSFAAQTAGQKAAQVAMAKGVERVRVLLKGLGPGRSTAVKGLKLGGLDIVEITDRTPEPHNGCRPPKARRL